MGRSRQPAPTAPRFAAAVIKVATCVTLRSMLSAPRFRWSWGFPQDGRRRNFETNGQGHDDSLLSRLPMPSACATMTSLAALGAMPPLVENAQEARLHLGRAVGNLVEEQRAAIRLVRSHSHRSCTPGIQYAHSRQCTTQVAPGRDAGAPSIRELFFWSGRSEQILAVL